MNETNFIDVLLEIIEDNISNAELLESLRSMGCNQEDADIFFETKEAHERR